MNKDPTDQEAQDVVEGRIPPTVRTLEEIAEAVSESILRRHEQRRVGKGPVRCSA